LMPILVVSSQLSVAGRRRRSFRRLATDD
jgi:hypothetical protein